jgi:D-sedoheptulose 7-phosphate isomerase
MAVFRDQADELAAVLAAMAPLASQVDAVAALVAEALLAGRTLFTCGNGGSAADAMHLSEELIGRYRGNRRPLPAICLNADVGAITCIANDFGYEVVFSRQLLALARPGDILVAFSTSGMSNNVMNVLAAARGRGVVSVALLGKGGGGARDAADHAIVVPSDNSARIQEIHGLILHAICEELEQRLEGASSE